MRQGLAFPIDVADRDGPVVAPGERHLGSRIKRKVVDDSGMGNVKEGSTSRVTMQARSIRMRRSHQSRVKKRCGGSNGGTVPGQDRVQIGRGPQSLGIEEKNLRVSSGPPSKANEDVVYSDITPAESTNNSDPQGTGSAPVPPTPAAPMCPCQDARGFPRKEPCVRVAASRNRGRRSLFRWG